MRDKGRPPKSPDQDQLENRLGSLKELIGDAGKDGDSEERETPGSDVDDIPVLTELVRGPSKPVSVVTSSPAAGETTQQRPAAESAEDDDEPALATPAEAADQVVDLIDRRMFQRLGKRLQPSISNELRQVLFAHFNSWMSGAERALRKQLEK